MIGIIINILTQHTAMILVLFGGFDLASKKLAVVLLLLFCGCFAGQENGFSPWQLVHDRIMILFSEWYSQIKGEEETASFIVCPM